jgi:acetate kinase
MKVIVLNVGSTSVKYQLYDMDSEATLAAGVVERVGSSAALHRWKKGDTSHEEAVAAPDAKAALELALAALGDAGEVRAVGHRVVHGGEKLIAPVVVTDEVKATIRACAAFAPLHNPANLVGIEAAQAVLPDAVHVAVFDTAFHAALPEHAYVYGLPYELYLQQGIRRYGFHGPSHQYMALRASEFLKTDLSRLKLITCHLGGGASVTAIDGGHSVDTSMGMTPLEGLIMGTRPGDLDPGLTRLLLDAGRSPAELEELYNKKSGLYGLSGLSADFRDLERAADEGHARARLAIHAFVHRLKKYVGAYAAVLGGVDAIVLSGGIGENAVRVRAALCESLVYMGVVVDAEANRGANARAAGGVVDIAAARAPTRVLVVATNEELMIAREAARTVAGPSAARRAAGGAPIPVGVSVRHVHLSRAHCDALFGAGYELTLRRPVSQPGQFVTRETVDLVGPKGELRGVAIINPLRKETQVELARTDAITLGVNPPLRESGKLDGTPGLKLRGPAGEVVLERGVILAHRHVHMHPDDARRFGVSDGSVVKISVDGERETVFGDVLVRVSPSYALDLHLDTDEANAAGLTNDSVASFEGLQ